MYGCVFCLWHGESNFWTTFRCDNFVFCLQMTFLEMFSRYPWSQTQGSSGRKSWVLVYASVGIHLGRTSNSLLFFPCGSRVRYAWGTIAALLCCENVILLDDSQLPYCVEDIVSVIAMWLARTPVLLHPLVLVVLRNWHQSSCRGRLEVLRSAWLLGISQPEYPACRNVSNLGVFVRTHMFRWSLSDRSSHLIERWSPSRLWYDNAPQFVKSQMICLDHVLILSISCPTSDIIIPGKLSSRLVVFISPLLILNNVSDAGFFFI